MKLPSIIKLLMHARPQILNVSTALQVDISAGARKVTKGTLTSLVVAKVKIFYIKLVNVYLIHI